MAIKDVEAAIRHCRAVLDDHYDLVCGHETYTRYTIIDPIIWALGWKTHVPDECQVEHQRGQAGRVDYALFNRDGECVILIEAKRVDRNSANFEEQLAKYARGIGDGVGVLTDGQLWHLYDLSQRGRFSNKYATTVDIYNDSVRQAAGTLNNMLSRRHWW